MKKRLAVLVLACGSPTRTAPAGWQIAGFRGRSGDEAGFSFTQR